MQPTAQKIDQLQVTRDTLRSVRGEKRCLLAVASTNEIAVADTSCAAGSQSRASPKRTHLHSGSDVAIIRIRRTHNPNWPKPANSHE